MVEVTVQTVHVNYLPCFSRVLCILIIPPLVCRVAVFFFSSPSFFFYVVYCTLAINFAQAAIWVIEEQT